MGIDSWVLLLIALAIVVIVSMSKKLIPITLGCLAATLTILLSFKSVLSAIPFFGVFLFFLVWTCRVWLFERKVENYIEEGQRLHNNTNNYNSDGLMKVFKIWSHKVGDDARHNKTVGKTVMALFLDDQHMRYNESELLGASVNAIDNLKILQIKHMISVRIDSLKELQKKL